MIFESGDWKEPLLEMAARLRSLKKTRLTEKRLAQLERDIFIGFYSVRKIFDTVTRVTDATKSLKVQVSWHPNLTPVTWRNNHRIDTLYDFKKEYQETRDLEFINGRIIHSFIFMPYVTEKDRLAGILFTSDRDKNKKLYSMKNDQVIAIFERVGNDYPTEMKWRIDPTTGVETMTLT
jgi:hypothetical protein